MKSTNRENETYPRSYEGKKKVPRKIAFFFWVNQENNNNNNKKRCNLENDSSPENDINISNDNSC